MQLCRSVARQAGSVVGGQHPAPSLAVAAPCRHSSVLRRFTSVRTQSVGDQKTTSTEQLDGAWVQEVLSEVADTQELGQRGEAWFAAQVAALLLVAFPPEALRGLVDLAGWAAVAGGLGLAVAGQQVLGKNLTPLPKPRDSCTLVTTGIYQYCRHPMYGGLLLASAGVSLALGDELRMVFASLVFLVLDRKASYEEELLEERFGEKYMQYKSTTKKLIPYVY